MITLTAGLSCRSGSRRSKSIASSRLERGFCPSLTTSMPREHAVSAQYCLSTASCTVSVCRWGRRDDFYLAPCASSSTSVSEYILSPALIYRRDLRSKSSDGGDPIVVVMPWQCSSRLHRLAASFRGCVGIGCGPQRLWQRANVAVVCCTWSTLSCSRE